MNKLIQKLNKMIYFQLKKVCRKMKCPMGTKQEMIKN